MFSSWYLLPIEAGSRNHVIGGNRLSRHVTVMFRLGQIGPGVMAHQNQLDLGGNPSSWYLSRSLLPQRGKIPLSMHLIPLS